MSKRHQRRKQKKAKYSVANTIPAKFWFFAGLAMMLASFGWYYLSDPSRFDFLKGQHLAKNSNPSEPTLPPVREKPKFEFYNILPNAAVEVATTETPTTPENPPKPAATTTPAPAQTPAPVTTVAKTPPKLPNTILTQDSKVPVYAAVPVPAQAKPAQTPANNKDEYIVQVAAFPKLVDADRLKAKLTMDGFHVRVSPLDTSKGKFYRVQIGPFTTVALAEQQKVRLQRAHYSAILRKTA